MLDRAAAPAAVVLLCMVLSPVPASGQWPGRIEGRVVDALSGRPVAAADVSPERVASPGASAVSTDASGRFRLTGLVDGPHVLVVRRPGYAPARVEVDVEEGVVSRVRIALDPAPVAVEGLDVPIRRTPAGGFRIEPDAGVGGTVGDVLEAAPGVVVRRRGEGGAETVSVRGSAPGEVLVLVDGVPLNDPLTGVADLSLVDAASVASVVVLPGARSAEHGPRAQGGVVLVETRLPGPGLRATAAAGSLGRIAGGVGLGGMRRGGSGWAVTLRRETVEGDFRHRLPPEVGGGEARRANADVARTTLTGALDADGERGSLVVRLRAEALDRGLPGRSFAPSPHARQTNRSGQLSATWEGGVAGARLVADAHGALRHGRVSDPAPPTGLPWDDRIRAWSAGAGLRIESGAGGREVSGGIDLRGQGVRADAVAESAPGTRIDLGLFAAAEAARPAGPLRLTGRLTGRVDRSGWDGAWVPSHEASLHATAGVRSGTSLAVHAAWRSAFTPPALADQHFRSGVGVEPNPDLRAERVPWELETGASATARAGPALLTGAVTLHRADVRDMIEWSPDFRFVWSPRNVDVERAGVELRAEARLPVASGAATVAGAWSRTRVTYDREGAGEGVQLRYRPRHAASLSLAWTSLRGRVEVAGRYTGLRHPVPAPVNALPGFWSVDVSARTRLPLGGRWFLAPALRVERLFDATDTLIFGFPHPGRTVSLSVELDGPGAGW